MDYLSNVYHFMVTQFISHRLADENLNGSAVKARVCLMAENLIDAGCL
jgi:hypothetical protein